MGREGGQCRVSACVGDHGRTLALPDGEDGAPPAWTPALSGGGRSQVAGLVPGEQWQRQPSFEHLLCAGCHSQARFTHKPWGWGWPWSLSVPGPPRAVIKKLPAGVAGGGLRTGAGASRACWAGLAGGSRCPWPGLRGGLGLSLAPVLLTSVLQETGCTTS